MAETSEGIFYPVIDVDKCIECGICVRSCHQLNNVDRNSISHVYAAWAKDNSIRTSSSSGGVFSVVAEFIINSGGVVYGAAYESGLKVRHIRVADVYNLNKLKGSKYIQSSTCGVYARVKADLMSGHLVLFSGTPCQIAGLRMFLKRKYENLICIDLVCHGVPPQRVFDAYIGKIGLDRANIDNFGFRYTKGWGFELSYDGKILSPVNSYYLRAFTKGYMFINACYSCKYATLDRVGDITLADFWNIGDYLPFEYSTRKGVSMMLINSDIGEKIICDIRNSLDIFDRSIEEATKTNWNLIKASEFPRERLTYIDDSYKLSKKDLIRKYCLSPSIKDYIRPYYRKLCYFFNI